ncbi:LPD38 domain-containing protein [Paenibacillus massiliensis]|uniref:LPD38 domain-containing protein n=1 Tax=Paenibacillus massiliensis TaxID=225917 RepID=UPI000403F6E0|nr:LPD38 domain-containing protein [Paenibacillus massiliensis]
MASRYEQFVQNQRKRADEIRSQALDGTLTPSAQQQKSLTSRSDAFKANLAAGKGPTTNPGAPNNPLPDALRITGPDFFTNSTLAQASRGNKNAINTVKQSTGVDLTQMQGPPAPTELDRRNAQVNAGPLGPNHPLAQFAKGMNWLAYGNPVGQFTTRAVGTGGSMVVGGPPVSQASTGNAAADKTADVLGTIGGVAGMAFNPAAPGVRGQSLLTGPLQAADGVLATRGGVAVTNTLAGGIQRVAPNVSAGTANRVAGSVLRGAATGAVGNTAAGLIQDQNSNGDILRNAALGAGVGGAADGIISGVGSMLRNSRVNRAQTADVIADADVRPIGLPEASTSPQGPLSRAATPIERIGRSPEFEPIRPNAPEGSQYSDFLNARNTRLNQVTPDVQPPKRIDITDEVEEIVQSVQNPRIRDRVYNYLDEAEQNARQRIANRKNRLSSTPVDEWADYAIIGAAKMGKGTIKFADWTEEMVKDLGESFRPNAQRVYNASKEELRKQERLATKEGDAAMKFNAQDIGDADSFSAKISRDVKKKRGSFAQAVEKVRSQFENDVQALAGLEKRVTGRVASAEDSLYKKARLFKGAPEKANQIVVQRLTPVVEAAEKAGYSADDIGKYALAVHAKDVNAAGYKSGFTNKEIEAVIEKYGTPEMEKARKELVQVGKDMLRELVDSGVISKELADVLDNRWKNYIPLFRSFDDTPEAFAGGLSKSLANVASPVKALQGSEKKVVDPLENMVRNIFQTVNAAERNKVASEITKLAKIDVEENFIRKLSPDEQVGRKNVVTVKENGESVKYEVEPEVYRALMNLDQESGNMLMNILSKPASLLRAGATLTPEFSLRNPMRDIVQAYVVSNSGFNPITDFTVGLIQSIKKGPLYQEWINNLGAYGNVLSMDRNVHRKALESVLKEKPSKKFVNVINGKALINVLRAITDTTESATKVGEYRAALRRGVTPQEAAYRSRDIMDFARAGSGIRQANRIVAFLNANIQGKSKLIRAIKENPFGTTTRMFTSVTAPTIGFYFLNKQFANQEQKQTINESPDWMKDTFWLVAIPNTNTVARIPKPFDIAPLFANLPERALQFVDTRDPEAFDGWMSRSLSDAALPAQITGLWPFIEGMANYSFFREGPIIPQREQGWEYKDQYDPVRTTEAAKLLAGLMSNVTNEKGMFKNFSSPRIMDNTIQGLTAGLGSYATSAVDSILKGIGATDRPDSPDKRIEQMPFFKAFLVDPLQSTKSIEQLYDLRTKLSSEKASAKLNDKTFNREEDLKMLNQAASNLSDINKEIRRIEADKTMNGKQKREQIEPLLAERNKIASTVMRGVKK